MTSQFDLDLDLFSGPSDKLVELQTAIEKSTSEFERLKAQARSTPQENRDAILATLRAESKKGKDLEDQMKKLLEEVSVGNFELSSY